MQNTSDSIDPLFGIFPAWQEESVLEGKPREMWETVLVINGKGFTSMSKYTIFSIRQSLSFFDRFGAHTGKYSDKNWFIANEMLYANSKNQF